jgi:toxin CptA
MLRINLRPSLLLAGILALAHGAVLLVIALIGIPMWTKITAAVVIVSSGAYCIRRYALLKGADAPVALVISPNNAFSFDTRSGECCECRVLDGTYVKPYLTVLDLQSADGRAIRRIVLVPDSLHAEDFRRLRVWLRWKEDRPEP